MQARAVHSAHRRPRWRVGLVALIAATLTAGVVPSATQAAQAPLKDAGVTKVSSTAAKEPSGFAVQLGPEQRLIGPTGQGDNPYFSERRGGDLFGYFGTSRTIEWRAHNNTRLTNSRIILDRGAAGKYDDCGAWMTGSFMKLTASHWIAFYHAEGSPDADDGDCDHYANTTVWRMGMVETFNGGKTWRNDSRKVVLAGHNATASTGVTNAGNGRAVRVGDYYYIFFETAHGPQPGPAGLHIARAPVSSGGMPGVWKKYFCTDPLIGDPVCGFSKDGIGGESTPIGGISEKARHIVWNGFLNRWLGFDASGKRGFRIFASPVGVGTTVGARQEDALFEDDGTVSRWDGSVDIYPLVSTEDDKYVDQWGGDIRNRRSKQLYAYPSIVGTEGQSCCGSNTFFVYYVKLFPGEKFTHRYLFRRKVTIVKSTTALNRVELTTYKNGKGQRRSSTEAPKEKAFHRVGPTGYLLSHGGVAGWKQVFDCSRRGDHALFAEKCKIGWRAVRRVGFVKAKKSGVANVPVYRCVAKRRHFAANTRRCGGGKREALIGWALRSL
jgi:hypothetical protein